MSLRAMQWAFSQNIQELDVKFILVILADDADEHFMCSPCFDSMEKMYKCPRSKVKKAIKWLVDNKYMQKLCPHEYGCSDPLNTDDFYQLLVKHEGML